MLYEKVDRESIREMVHTFYAVILKDDVLGPIFTKALGADLKNGKWPEHFQTLEDFWVLMMTGAPGYGGDPFPPHAFLGGLTREMFEKWLVLFKATIYDMYVPAVGDKFYKKAEILSEQFIDNLGIDDDDDDDW